MIGDSQDLTYFTKDWLLLQFSDKRTESETRYQEFVRKGIKGESPWKKVKGQLYLGEENFIDKIKELIKSQETLQEIPRMQRYITKPSSLEEIFKQ
ncbi:hypothetical protein [Candidatus Hakubella thermalkaliphila]|uniref:Uncharacterized protein n=1 Tax=Candidatus Hakubella thermalkaliphila TaxID=2754717 RepID=A0A6V8P8T9_9ACTN|nr:hypothetical protein [Candidatus Hakubella thermalkaliphila]GFP28743.1 hypothetical protein HKBW3S33_02159 [Candidatus Hakubella thermalkaliphila]